IERSCGGRKHEVIQRTKRLHAEKSTRYCHRSSVSGVVLSIMLMPDHGTVPLFPKASAYRKIFMQWLF
uniref:Uncharacterized protein n=1 Tax=Chlorocebus sabaeus TaxID=60711 RepID=A0A0D9S042_CHLSB